MAAIANQIRSVDHLFEENLILKVGAKTSLLISSLIDSNLNQPTIVSFGDDWSRFDQQAIAPEVADRVFNDYFAIFHWHILPPDAEGFDMGCGSGCWDRFFAPRVGWLHCIDPSSALEVACQTLSDSANVQFPCLCRRQPLTSL